MLDYRPWTPERHAFVNGHATLLSRSNALADPPSCLFGTHLTSDKKGKVAFQVSALFS
jgi:hypothetical protein